ncbi:MAG: hypothetical protein ACP5D2_01020 [Candidatus Nanoarchaeia archaeon]
MMNMMDYLKQVKEKKEYAGLPDSLIKRVLRLQEVRKEQGKARIKRARAILRKYFTVFLTNKVLKLEDELILTKHKSTQHRDYKQLYRRILGQEAGIIDLGAGVNGFSYPYINEISKRRYLAIEASKQLVDKMNQYFQSRNYLAKAIQADLFDLEEIVDIVRENSNHDSVVWLFQVIDALEGIQRDYSKRLISALLEYGRVIVSFSLRSLSGRSKLAGKKWLFDFFKTDGVKIKDNFIHNGERFMVLERHKNSSC